ncbi:MAG: DedA family protein [Burkholderiaceae bacterium]|nr:DedA family protein [Burkholderiaceae bacterium]
MSPLATDWIALILGWLALPEIGLGAVFVVSLLAATVLPLGSEPFVAGYAALNPAALWVTVAVATLGNTLGGMTTYWVGRGVHGATEHLRQSGGSAETPLRDAGTGAQAGEGVWQRRAHRWAVRFGPAVLLLSWLPVVGDPLCAVAGWLRLPFWRCVLFMAAGKGLRYLALCSVAALLATR